jgi:DNA-binding transcriptional ArsR family regulator
MHEGPSITGIAAIIGERGRAQILTALMSGRALTATELADISGVTRPTVSSHLRKLEHARLIAAESQGRHRYFRLAGSDVAQLLESMMGAAYQALDLDRTFGPRDPELRKARLCYDHLAGELGVLIYDGLQSRSAFSITPQGLLLNDCGWEILGKLGLRRVDVVRSRRPVCRACMDWSERRHHLAGTLGKTLMTRLAELHWAAQLPDSRVVRFSTQGERALREIFTPLTATHLPAAAAAGI